MVAAKHCDYLIQFLGKTIAASTDYYLSYFPDKIVDGMAANTTDRDSYCNSNPSQVLHRVHPVNKTRVSIKQTLFICSPLMIHVYLAVLS